MSNELKFAAAGAPPSLHLDATEKNQRDRLSRWSWAVVATAGAFVGIVTTILVVNRLHQEAPTPVQAGHLNAARPSPDKPATVESLPRPTWVGRRQAIWARDGSKTIAFELQASNDVPVWMTRVRPVLVVRCLYRMTEVFVATASAASIQPQAETHTVRLQIDNDQELLQQWSDSESGQELFAPDGLTLTRRLARAHHMRFGFVPYNAKPVVVEFVVEGFDKLASRVASTCGWRLDDSGTPRTRPIHLK